MMTAQSVSASTTWTVTCHCFQFVTIKVSPRFQLLVTHLTSLFYLFIHFLIDLVLPLRVCNNLKQVPRSLPTELVATTLHQWGGVEGEGSVKSKGNVPKFLIYICCLRVQATVVLATEWAQDTSLQGTLQRRCASGLTYWHLARRAEDQHPLF